MGEARGCLLGGRLRHLGALKGVQLFYPPDFAEFHSVYNRATGAEAEEGARYQENPTEVVRGV
jgi:hypothetical protein